MSSNRISFGTATPTPAVDVEVVSQNTTTPTTNAPAPTIIDATPVAAITVGAGAFTAKITMF